MTHCAICCLQLCCAVVATKLPSVSPPLWAVNCVSIAAHSKKEELIVVVWISHFKVCYWLLLALLVVVTLPQAVL